MRISGSARNAWKKRQPTRCQMADRWVPKCGTHFFFPVIYYIKVYCAHEVGLNVLSLVLFIFQANIVNRFGGVKMEDIRGLRVPYLKPGWNRQFLMMKEFGFVYDSSIPAPLSDPPLWPYTLDYKIPHKCIGRRKCPSRSFPGIWVSKQFFRLGL